MKKIRTLTALFLLVCFCLMLSSPAIAADVQAAYTKIPNDLLTAFNAVGNNGKLDVLVWLEDDATDDFQTIVSSIPEPVFDESPIVPSSSEELQTLSLEDSLPMLSEEEQQAQMTAMQQYIMQKRQIAQAVYLEANNAKVQSIAPVLDDGDITYISKYSSMFICNVTLDEAVDIAMQNDVLQIENGSVEVNPTMDVSRVATSVHYVQNFYNITAAGINIGMIEPGTPDLSYACFSGLTDRIHLKEEASTDLERADFFRAHASIVAAIMIGKDSGIAKDFESFYSAPTPYRNQIYENTEWMLDQGVNVINYSMSVGQEVTTSYSNISKWFDHIAYNHSVHCVMTSGNSGQDLVSNIGMAYNVITVAAIDDKNTLTRDDDTYWDGSSYNKTVNNLAYKPDICAPGNKIEIPNVSIEYVHYSTSDIINIENGGGTSAAAPHVSGIVAVLCAFNPTLLTKQALTKSILLNSVSQKYHRYDTEDTVDDYRKYGSGIVNLFNAIFLSASGNYANITMGVDETQRVHSIGTLQSGQTISVTLSFLKYARIHCGEHDGDDFEQPNVTLADLDIYVCPVNYHPSMIYKGNPHLNCSFTSNNNVEKVVFTVPTTAEYVIIVNKHSGSDSYHVVYGLSWYLDNGSPLG